MADERGNSGSTPGPEVAGVSAPLASTRFPWKQTLAVVVAALLVLLLFRVAGVPIVLAGVFTFLDARHSGIRKKAGSKSFVNLTPGAWGVAVMGLTIVAYPCYLISRGKLKTKEGPGAYWVLANIFALIALAWAVLGLAVLMARAA
jgi:hypothetical protein